jgi:tetratricopeptide (TPR) repeat protein
MSSASIQLCIFLCFAAAGNDLDPLEAGIRQFNEGYRSWDLERMREAAAMLAPLCGTTSSSYDACYWLGAVRFHILLHRLGDTRNPPDKKEKRQLLEEAVAPLEQAVKLRRDDSEAHALLGTLKGMQIAAEPASALWRGQEVLEHRRLALENDPANPRAPYLIGSAYFHMPAILGRKDKGLEFFLSAKGLFEKEQATKPPLSKPSWGYASCLTFIGRIYEGMGKKDEARAGFLRALDVNPGDKLAKACLDKLNGAEPNNAKQ